MGRGLWTSRKSSPAQDTPQSKCAGRQLQKIGGQEAEIKQKDIKKKKKKKFIVDMKQQSHFQFHSQQLLLQPKIHN